MDDVACYCTNFRRAALALTAVYDAAFAPHGITVTQFSLLHAVKRRGPASLTTLAGATGLDRSTLGRNLRRLAGEGLVSLSTGEDQRDRVAMLTAEGQARVAAATRTWREVQESVAGALGGDADALVAGARRVARMASPAARAAEVAP